MAEAAQLKQRVQEGATSAEREAGLNGIVQFVEAVGRPSEPFVVPLLPAVLKSLADKVRTSCRKGHAPTPAKVEERGWT